jgi:DNA (cytosine-5)-methyltransferase 1
LVFDEVQADLEAEGYEVQPYVLPAVSVNAPHRRDRVWFVAFNTNSTTSGKERNLGRKDGSGISGASEKGVFQETHNKCFGFGEVPPEERITSNTSKAGLERGASERIQKNERGERKSRELCLAARYSRCDWEKFPTQSPICGGNDGLPTELDGITFPKWRNESIKAYGNAIVPQVALQIFKAIQEYKNKTLKKF